MAKLTVRLYPICTLNVFPRAYLDQRGFFPASGLVGGTWTSSLSIPIYFDIVFAQLNVLFTQKFYEPQRLSITGDPNDLVECSPFQG